MVDIRRCRKEYYFRNKKSKEFLKWRSYNRLNIVESFRERVMGKKKVYWIWKLGYC